MISEVKQFVLPQETSVEAIKSEIADLARASIEQTDAVDLVYFDTFDWRLFRKESVLEGRKAGDGWQLDWSSLNGRGSLGRLTARREPVFAGDLSDGPATERLAGAVQMRALMPLVQLSTRRALLARLDDDDKTVLRLSIEEATARDADGRREATLGRRLIVRPVRGYDRVFRKTITKLERRFGPPEDHGPLYLTALQALGTVPGDYSSKFRLDLAADETAEAALRRVCLVLLRVIERNVPGTLAATDTEFLHDLRVAIRRTRTALIAADGLFPDAVVDRFKKEFRWLMHATGPARDLDVFLLDMPAYRQRLDSDLQDALDPVEALLSRRRRAEQRRLATGLNSARFRRLVADWRAFLEGDTPEEHDKQVRRVAGRAARTAFERLIRDGRRIGTDSADEMLHDLRKRGKRLRYLLEFFRPVLGQDDVVDLLRPLKRLQDVLGRFQDYAVQRDALLELGRALGEEPKTPPETLMALGTLAAQLSAEQRAARTAFADGFAAIDRPGLCRRAKHLGKKDATA